MRAMIPNILLLVAVLLLCMQTPMNAASRIKVYTVNYPLTYFTERIGAEYVQVVFPAPDGADPAFWTPDAEIVRQYQQADLIILNGADYAKWTKQVSLPMLRSVDTSRGFKDQLIRIESRVTHSHGPGGEHSHGGTAFTTWLDFSQAAMQAEAIYLALTRKLPEHKTELAANFQSLKTDLEQLDSRMKALGVALEGTPLLGSHPVYQYLARRYDLNLEMVMWEPDADPGEGQWRYVKDLLKEHRAAWMIWEGAPLAESAERLQAMQVQSLVFSPCFARPAKGDFLSVMNENISKLNTIAK